MLKETITYTDYNGVERTEDCYFDLSKAELVEMHLSTDGGLDTMLDRIVKAKNGSEIIRVFKMLLMKAYGEKSDDGRHFRKSEELSQAFTQTPMYDKLFMELVTDSDKAAKFVKGITPDMPDNKPAAALAAAH